MSVLARYDGKLSFWEANPQFKILGMFAKLYKSDRTKAKIRSSEIMWALAFLLEISDDNKLKNFSEADRKMVIQQDYLNLDNFDWKEYQDYIDYYIDTQMTTTKKALRLLRIKMEERYEFLSSTRYDIDNAKELDAIMANTEKLFALISRLEAQVEKEDNSAGGTVRGGRTESASELGQI